MSKKLLVILGFLSLFQENLFSAEGTPPRKKRKVEFRSSSFSQGCVARRLEDDFKLVDDWRGDVGSAVCNNDTKKLCSLFEKPERKKYVNFKNQLGFPLLILAVKSKSYEVLKFLLTIEEINCGASDEDEKTALMHALEMGDKDSFKILLDYSDVDLSLQDKNGLTHLMYAMNSNMKRAFEIILDKYKSNSKTSDIYLPNCDDKTVLDIAIEKGNKDFVKNLAYLFTAYDIQESIDKLGERSRLSIDQTTILKYLEKMDKEN